MVCSSGRSRGSSLVHRWCSPTERAVALACVPTAAVLAVVPGEKAAARVTPCAKSLTATATCSTVAMGARKATVLSLEKACNSESKRRQVPPCHSYLSCDGSYRSRQSEC
ncbi:hypothetical protein VPH35_120205 [Triticum aestivum]